MKKIDFVIRMLKEIQLNYKFQYPNNLPNMQIIVKEIEQNVNNVFMENNHSQSKYNGEYENQLVLEKTREL